MNALCASPTTWLRVDRLLGEHGIQQDTALSRQEFEMRMEARRAEESDEESLAVFRRGWCLGSPEFKARMLERMEGQLGEHHSGEMRLEGAEAKAKRIIHVMNPRIMLCFPNGLLHQTAGSQACSATTATQTVGEGTGPSADAGQGGR